MARGRYTIVGKLADGGMAEIFLATQHGAEGFQKPVVLKRILTAFSADPQFRNMFLDEAQISMSLSHGNIVQVLDVGVSGDRTFLVLELVEGWDLEEVMERARATGPEHPWPPSLALYVAAQLCRGLSYAHAKRGPDGRPLGIVHRDVSPNNVLVSEQGEVKLADFGIAKADSKREQTLAGVIKGKIGFMSPEQALGRSLDARADIFSVGTVLYLMLTGRRPFHAGSELESMMLAQRAEYRPPEELNPYLSPEATAIVNRAMRLEPAQRYQTADQMLTDVERVLRSQYHSAGQTELKTWLAELTRRDGVSPIGRPRPDEGAAPLFVDQAGELSAGSSLELSDIDGTAAAGVPAAVFAAPTAVAIALGGPANEPPKEVVAGREEPGRTATPRPPLATASPASSATVDTVASLPAPDLGASPRGSALAKARRPRRSRVGIGFVLGALCMLSAVFAIRWLAQWAGRERIGTSNDSARSKVTGESNAIPTNPNGALATPSRVVNAVVETPPVAQGLPARTTGSDAAAPVVPAVPEPTAGALSRGTETERVAPPQGLDDDEEHLLGLVVPDAATVIGEDEAEEKPRDKAERRRSQDSGRSGTTAAPPRPAGPQARSTVPSTFGADAERRGPAGHTAGGSAARPQPVQIRITTSPLGAVVRTKKQVLGRTPLAIRFNPGNTYELTFVKSGYVTNSRRLAVFQGKPQSISVAMKKAPPPHRHGLLRGR
jgi:serine/threonine protein kinase